MMPPVHAPTGEQTHNPQSRKTPKQALGLFHEAFIELKLPL